MSSYLHSDNVSTSVIVRKAGEKLGKIGSAPEIQRICDYLINKNWFQTAADLRIARENTQEWHMLEIPGRLKIAIQEELDAMTSGSDVVGADESEYDGSTALETSTETTQDGEVYCEEVNEESQVVYEQGFYTAEEEAAHAAAWAAYYATNGYDTSTTEAQVDYTDASHALPESLEDGTLVVDGYIDETVVTAHAVDPDFTSPTSECTSTSPVLFQWTCGQCTYMNAISEAFCEMCQGHISLSPDRDQLASITCMQEEEVCSAAEKVVAFPLPAPAVLEVPLYTSIPSPTTSVYSPSAPDFEDDDSQQINLSTPTWCVSNVSNKVEHISFASLALDPMSGPKTSSEQPIDFFSLAFHKSHPSPVQHHPSSNVHS